MYCTNCGTEIPADVTLCSACGHAFDQPSIPKSAIQHTDFRRVVAYLVDVLMGSFLPMLVAIAIGRALTVSGLWVPASLGTPDSSVGDTGFDILTMWNSMTWMHRLSVVLSFNLFQGLLYFSLCHSSPWQATVGKRWQKMIVVDKDSARLSFGRALWRALAKVWFVMMIPPFGLAFQVGSVFAAKQNRAIHDFLARTVVIQGRAPERARLGYWRVALCLLVPPLFLLATFVTSGVFQFPDYPTL